MLHIHMLLHEDSTWYELKKWAKKMGLHYLYTKAFLCHFNTIQSFTMSPGCPPFCQFNSSADFSRPTAVWPRATTTTFTLAQMMKPWHLAEQPPRHSVRTAPHTVICPVAQKWCLPLHAQEILCKLRKHCKSWKRGVITCVRPSDSRRCLQRKCFCAFLCTRGGH